MPPPQPPWPPADTITSALFEVHPPNQEILQPESGIGVPKHLSDPYLVVTKWFYNGTPVVMDASTTCDEKLLYIQPSGQTTFLDYGQAAGPNTSTWMFNINTFTDTKAIGSSEAANWKSLPVDVPLLDLWQKNRLKYWDDGDGTYKYIEGPSRLWRRTRVLNDIDPYIDMWKLVEVPGQTPPTGYGF